MGDKGQIVARVGEALDLLQIVQDDRPFLVDSVMGELVEQGVSIRAMLHRAHLTYQETQTIRGMIVALSRGKHRVIRK